MENWAMGVWRGFLGAWNSKKTNHFLRKLPNGDVRTQCNLQLVNGPFTRWDYPFLGGHTCIPCREGVEKEFCRTHPNEHYEANF